jgi:hypothetical protein
VRVAGAASEAVVAAIGRMAAIKPLGEIAAVADLPFVLRLDQHRAGQPKQGGGVGEVPTSGRCPQRTTSVRRLISLFSRSRGLVDQIFFQWPIGKAVKASSEPPTSPETQGCETPTVCWAGC